MSQQERDWWYFLNTVAFKAVSKGRMWEKRLLEGCKRNGRAPDVAESDSSGVTSTREAFCLLVLSVFTEDCFRPKQERENVNAARGTYRTLATDNPRMRYMSNLVRHIEGARKTEEEKSWDVQCQERLKKEAEEGNLQGQQAEQEDENDGNFRMFSLVPV